MDIHIYVEDTPFISEYEKPQVLLPLLDGTLICENDEEHGIECLNNKRRLNIYVYEGWDGDWFLHRL